MTATRLTVRHRERHRACPTRLPPAITRPRQPVEAVLAQSLHEMGDRRARRAGLGTGH